MNTLAICTRFITAKPDDKVVVTVYFFNDEVSGPERCIGATIWSPSAE